MKNKILEYFFTIANVLIFLGIVISSILIISAAKKIVDEPANGFKINELYYLPYIIFLAISVVFIVIFMIFKYNYFKLISMHVKHTWIYLHYLSCAIVILNYVFASLMFIFAPQMSANAIKSYYLFITIAVVGIITLIATAINAYSKIKIKIELVVRRTKGKEQQEIKEVENKGN